LVTDRHIPALRDDYILVKVVAIALNPTDWKHIDFLAPVGAIIGCDYAGIVEEVGEAVTKPFKKGDRICGFAHGGNAVSLDDGSFAEYITVKGDVQIKIPDNLSFQEAATLGVGVTTVGQGLYQSLKLSHPTRPLEEPEPLLIYGGSTATGTLAIQFAKLSGYQVITTCSPHNADLVKRLGADIVIDYNETEAAERIRKLTANKLRLVFDTISLESSAQFCNKAISTEGGEYSSLLDVKVNRDNVSSKFTLAYTAIGEAFDFGPHSFPAKPEDKDFARGFWDFAEGLLADGKIKVHPLAVGKDGLKGALEGLDLMRNGLLSGQKLVYNIVETP
jgi:NADPH:quinone reductase-like Zn-dependent oxidoreductase